MFKSFLSTTISMCLILGHFLSAPTAQAVGTSSGGGGFVDVTARGTLDLAKLALARMITNSSPSIYENFPKDRGQAWLSQLIRNVELRENDKSRRYGKMLKFNYTLRPQKIFATSFYALKFPEGRAWMRSARERHSLIIEVMMDLLHEAAHFYDIGVTQETDPNAETWAMFLMDALSKDVLSCLSEKIVYRDSISLRTSIDASALTFHRPSGLFMTKAVSFSNNPALVSKSYGEWRSNLYPENYRFLTDPRRFLRQDEWDDDNQRNSRDKNVDAEMEKKNTIVDRRLLLKAIVNLAGSERATPLSPLDVSDEFNFIFQSYDSHGIYSSLRRPFPREISAVFGPPEVTAQEIRFSRKKDYGPHDDPKSMELFEDFRLNPKTLKARYTYGVKTDRPELAAAPQARSNGEQDFFTRSFAYTCESLSSAALPVKEFIRKQRFSDEELKALERRIQKSTDSLLPQGLQDQTNFLRAFDLLHASQKNSELQGLSATGRPCEMRVDSSPTEPERTLVISLHEDQSASDESTRSGFLQTNFAKTSSGWVNSDDLVNYNLMALSASHERIQIRQAGSEQFQKVGDGNEKGVSHVEVNIEIDASSGRFKRAEMFDHLNPSSKLSCLFN